MKVRYRVVTRECWHWMIEDGSARDFTLFQSEAGRRVIVFRGVPAF
jgi:hypothetical protein